MPRRIRIAVIALAVGLAVALGFFVDIVGRVRSLVETGKTEDDPFKLEPKPLFTPTDPAVAVKIFFPAAEEARLSTEDRIIFQSAELANRAKQILQSLADGPKSPELAPALPKDAKAVEVYIAGGVAYVDFTGALAANHPGGILHQQATIYSIVNSLTYPPSEIHKVKILVGGTEKETLAGHILLRLPFDMDLSITDIAPPDPEKTEPEENEVPETNRPTGKPGTPPNGEKQ
jgi:hypothetical protein